jgi:hypothetical protein
VTQTSILALAGTAVVVVALGGLWFLRRPPWMGMGDKTLWDWLTLALVPLGIAIGTLALTATQEQIARDRAEEGLFQDFVDRISALTLSEFASSPRAVAVGRSQTAAILQVLEGERAGRVLMFLHDMELIADYEPNLDGLDLAGAELKGIVLVDQGFEGTDLRGADLEGAHLADADLERTDLSGADLESTVLRGASFEATILSNASLAGADLRGADLREAVDLEASQLAVACMDASTQLPEALAGEVEVACRDAGSDSVEDDGD